MNFYESLPVFTDFERVTGDEYYRAVPRDWVLVMTDVKDSAPGHCPRQIQGRKQDGRGHHRGGAAGTLYRRVSVCVRGRRSHLPYSATIPAYRARQV